METITERDLIVVATWTSIHNDPAWALMDWMRDANHWRLFEQYTYRKWFYERGLFSY